MTLTRFETILDDPDSILTRQKSLGHIKVLGT